MTYNIECEQALKHNSLICNGINNLQICLMLKLIVDLIEIFSYSFVSLHGRVISESHSNFAGKYGT